MINNNLKPCPFCGCKNFKDKLELFAIPTDGSGTAFYTYKCPKCKTEFVLHCKSEEEANEKWNDRANI